MTGPELHAILKAAGISQTAWAKHCGVTQWTACAWCNGRVPVPYMVARSARRLKPKPGAIVDTVA